MNQLHSTQQVFVPVKKVLKKTSKILSRQEVLTEIISGDAEALKLKEIMVVPEKFSMKLFRQKLKTLVVEQIEKLKQNQSLTHQW